MKKMLVLSDVAGDSYIKIDEILSIVDTGKNEAKICLKNGSSYKIHMSSAKIVEYLKNNDDCDSIKPNYYKVNGDYKDLIEELYATKPKKYVDGFIIGNIVKYIQRYDQKNGIEDLKKAKEYCSRLITDKPQASSNVKLDSCYEETLKNLALKWALRLFDNNTWSKDAVMQALGALIGGYKK